MPKLERNGIPLSYEVSGSGPPVVLGHSFLCSGEMWTPQVGPLALGYQVINPDLRGHGNSGVVDAPFDLYDLVDDVLAVLDHLAIERAVWAGLSIGGMVALRAAPRATQNRLQRQPRARRPQLGWHPLRTASPSSPEIPRTARRRSRLSRPEPAGRP